MLYIKPPRGNISLEELRECVTTRMQYFAKKYRSDHVDVEDGIKFQYLTLGTALDRTGHFTLRLLSAGNKTLKDLVPSYEAIFLMERTEYLSNKELLYLVKTTIKHLNECEEQNNQHNLWIEELKIIFSEIKLALASKHFLTFQHDEKCSQFKFEAPFQMCLPLVAKRELFMSRGKVIVPCGKWKIFFRHLSEQFVKNCISEMERSEVTAEQNLDDRLKEIKYEIIHLLRRKGVSREPQEVRIEHIKTVKECFPPCMSYLYDNLVKNHRLSHNARFRFSLFLKDIGMSLSDSLEFWQNEYSKPTKCGSKCTHSWQKDSAKFTYGIRHLYGLEGKRAKYSSPSCYRIQESSLGPTEEGGCPFANFDFVKLKDLLSAKSCGQLVDFDIINSMVQQQKFVEACKYYRDNKENSIAAQGVENIVHETPVEYFVIMKKIKSIVV